MKKEYLLLEFSAVFLIFIVPPLLVGTAPPAAFPAHLQLETVLRAAVAAALHAQFRPAPRHNTRFAQHVARLQWGALTTGLLMLIFAAFELLALLVPQAASAAATGGLPQTAAAWLSALLAFACSAYYEEVLYRLYLPAALGPFLGNARWARLMNEALPLMLFALAHRYLGWAAVLNAACCGAVLRLCLRKTGGVATGTAAHFLYNALLLLFAAAAR